MTQLVWWIVGVVVAVFIALFGFFAGVAAYSHSPQSYANLPFLSK